MRIIMLGVNHRTAPVALREKLAVAGDAAVQTVQEIRRQHGRCEAAVLSTCNRIEWYLVRPSHEPPKIDQLREMMAAATCVSLEDLVPVTILRENDQAIIHLFRVATGLESMVLGEPQILGQVRSAYEAGIASGGVGPVLHKVFREAITVAKRARTVTRIDEGRISIGSVAVEFAQGIFERFDDKTVLGIGAGEMAKLALRRLLELSPQKLWLTNRTPERARALASQISLDPARYVRPMDDLDNLLVEADIVITSTASTDPIITASRFRRLARRRRNRPVFIIDIAMPRDVDPAVGGLSNVYLYNIDDLQQVVARTRQARSESVAQCEAMLNEAADECMRQLQRRHLGRLIHALRQRLAEIGEAETQRTVGKLNSSSSAELDELIEEHTRRLINKILHQPLSQIGRRDAPAPLAFYAAALRRLFDLDESLVSPGEFGNGCEEEQ